MAAPRSARSRPRRPGKILVPIGICGIALALRAIALDRDQLWFDEAYSALVALSSPTDIVSEAARDSSPPLYYLLLHGWAMLFGSASRALRSLSVVFGVATVLITGMLGRQLWGAAAGTLGMMLLAVSPLHIYYSREVRAYALLALLAVLSVIALERLIQRGTRTSVLFYSGVVVAACYTHNYGLLLPVALLISLVQGRLPWTRGLVCLAIIAAAYAPWLPVLVRQMGSGATGWIAPWWHATPPALALARSFAVFCFGGARPPYLTLGSGGLPPIAVFASYLTFALVLGRSLMRPSPEAGRRMAVMCVLLLAVPVAVSFVAPVYLVGRHDVFALPFFLLLSARGTELLQTPIRWVCLVTMIVLGGVSTAAYYARPPVTGDAERAMFLAQTARPGDLILCTAFTRNALGTTRESREPLCGSSRFRPRWTITVDGWTTSHWPIPGRFNRTPPPSPGDWPGSRGRTTESGSRIHERCPARPEF